MEKLMSLLGCVAFIGLAYVLSTNKKEIRWSIVVWGIGLQVVIGIILIPDSFFNLWLKDILSIESSPGEIIFGLINAAVNKILGFARVGMNFVLANFVQGKVLIDLNNIIFTALPIIIFFSALISLLYYLGIMQKVVKLFAYIMLKTMKISGAESFAVASKIFVGMVEAGLSIRPFISRLTKSELFALMVGGLTTIAGSVLGVYVGMLSTQFPNIAGHLTTASVMSAPAAFAIAKIMIPETETPVTMGNLDFKVEKTSVNAIDAISNGALDGLKIAMNVGAILLCFVALIHLVDYLVILPQTLFGVENPYDLEKITGYLFSPIAVLLGIPWEDAHRAGVLLGEKTILNELIAYSHLGDTIAEFHERSRIILSYALCGFANFGSVAIMIGGLRTMAPDRSKEISRLGMKSLLAGLMGGFMTACVAGLII